MPTIAMMREVPASPQSVWEVLADYPGMTKWAGARSVSIERAGTDVPAGVGTIRALRSWRGTLREEITAFEPGQRIGYSIISGLPVRDYRTLIELEPHKGGTRITWTVNFTPRALAAPVLPFAVKRVLNTIMDRLTEEVNSRTTTEAKG